MGKPNILTRGEAQAGKFTQFGVGPMETLLYFDLEPGSIAFNWENRTDFVLYLFAPMTMNTAAGTGTTLTFNVYADEAGTQAVLLNWARITNFGAAANETPSLGTNAHTLVEPGQWVRGVWTPAQAATFRGATWIQTYVHDEQYSR